MLEDIVISSYKEQIKESILKAEAVKIAGFDIIIEEIKRRGVDVSKLSLFFDKIRNSTTKQELDNLTVDELNTITDDINMQVTKALISPVDIADILIRKSKIIAKEKSPNGKVLDSDNYLKVGMNLANEVNKFGVANGLNTCIKNYCVQKLYQANYREKIKEKEKELGIEVEEETKQKTSSARKEFDTRKSKTMIDILGKNVADINTDTFENIKNNYLIHLNEKVTNLKDYK